MLRFLALLLFYTNLSFAADGTNADSTSILPISLNNASNVILHSAKEVAISPSANKPTNWEKIDTIYKLCPTGLTPSLHYSLAKIDRLTCPTSGDCVQNPIESSMEIVPNGNSLEIWGYAAAFAITIGNGALHPLKAYFNYTVYCNA